MTTIFVILVVSLFFSFIVYWYIKFKYVLPIEKKINFIDESYYKFQEFSRDISKYNYIPENIDQFNDFLNHILIKFHSFFTDTFVFIFETTEGEWKLSWALSNEKIDFGEKWNLLFNIFNKSINENDLILMTDLGATLQTDSFKDAVIFPIILTAEKIDKLIFIGFGKSINSASVLPYVKYISMQLNLFYKLYEKVSNLKKENLKLKSELDTMMKELDMAGSRLIKKARERKALYEIVSKVTYEDDVKKGLSAVLGIVAGITEADMVVCFLYEDSTRSLVLNPNVYGGKLKDIPEYKIPVEDRNSIFVKSFLDKKLFIVDKPDYKDKFFDREKWGIEINSLIVVPIFLRSEMIGVLGAASEKTNFFTSEHLEFLNVIADELAVIISMINLYDRLSKTADELIQMNKIKDDFLSTVSHELKTPLTTIKGFISVLMSGEVGALTDQQISFLSIVDQAATRLGDLISNLLDISRLNNRVEMEMAPCDLKEIVRNAITALALKAKEKNITINFHSDKNISYVLGDAHWLGQVVENILSNAIKYSPEKTKVDISIMDRGDVVTVKIADEGKGIPEDEQKLIFEKFYRGKHTRNDYHGTGLGLYISKSVIEKHNGKIWVESEVGKGSKFYFALPKLKEVNKI